MLVLPPCGETGFELETFSGEAKAITSMPLARANSIQAYPSKAV